MGHCPQSIDIPYEMASIDRWIGRMIAEKERAALRQKREQKKEEERKWL